MPFSPEQREKIAAVLQQKAPTGVGCPLCSSKDWSIGNDLVMFVLQPNIKNMRLSGTGHPCIPITCKACGNTQFVNALILGLGEVLSIPPAEEKKEG